MFAEGLTGPIRPMTGETIDHTPPRTATVWPTMTNNIPWKYVMVSSGSNTLQSFAAGDSSSDASTDAWFYVGRDSGPVIVNVS